jgi:iron complex transport system permease protein
MSTLRAGDPHVARRRLAMALAVLSAVLIAAGLGAGSEGWSWPRSDASNAALIIGQIRAPRSVGAWLVGALLGLAGAIAQGLFRNPLADPYLLGSAAGASLAAVLVLAAGSLMGSSAGAGEGATTSVLGFAGGLADGLARVGLVGASFVGALGGVMLTLVMARGAQHSARLLLAGVVVGVVLAALGDLVASVAPEALRERQSFLLGSTGFLDWTGVALLACGLLIGMPLAWRLARLLDALTLGEDTAESLGLATPRWRALLVAVLAFATGLAVSQAGLIAFVGLVAPHLVRRFAPAPNGYTLVASAAAGGVLLLGADVLARVLIAPQELPVGVVTAVLGGAYLLVLLQRGRAA